MTTRELLLSAYASGDLQRLVLERPTQASLAAALGMTLKMYRSGHERLVRSGELPSWTVMRKGAKAEAEVPSGTEAVESARKWSTVAAFDAGYEIPLDPIPDGFRVKAVSTLVDADGNTEAQWIGSGVGDTMESFVAAQPVGHFVKGVSTLVGADGTVRGQWIKTSAQTDARQDWLEAIREVMAEPRAELEPLAATEYPDDDTLTVLPVGDPHVGLKAWREDAGENFDMKIAERNLVAAFRHLVALAPASREALIIFIGDNTHSDGQSNTTTRGTRVDVDDRTIKMMRVVVSCARQAIDISLAKFGRVTMIVERGNHDELLSAMLALALSLLYENEPRVTIDTSPEVFHWYRFGANLIGTHHGDKTKPVDLLGVMAVDRQKDWGETKHRRWYTGHLHHMITKEVHTVIIETLPTLAASDAWHRSMGYRSGRAMYMDIIHREHGHVNRHVVGIGQLVG